MTLVSLLNTWYFLVKDNETITNIEFSERLKRYRAGNEVLTDKQCAFLEQHEPVNITRFDNIFIVK